MTNRPATLQSINIKQPNASDTANDTPALTSLYAYVTNECNLRCMHCWCAKAQMHNFRQIDVHEMAGALREARPLGLKSVKLTGGEPLIHDRIDDLVALVRDNDLSLSVETNGTCCTENIIADLGRCRTSIVSVSLDAIDAATHDAIRGQAGCFQAAIDTLRRLSYADIPTEIIMTIMRSNKHQIIGMVELAQSLKVKNLKFGFVQPSGRGRTMHANSEALTVAEAIDCGNKIEQLASAQQDLLVFTSLPMAFLPMQSLVKRLGMHSCGALGTLGLLPDGSYSLCGAGQMSKDLVLGKVSHGELSEIWLNHPLLLELRTGSHCISNSICADCSFRELCQGYCLALNYIMYGTFWRSHWFCAAARENGLFPEDRIGDIDPALRDVLDGERVVNLLFACIQRA